VTVVAVFHALRILLGDTRIQEDCVSTCERKACAFSEAPGTIEDSWSVGLRFESLGAVTIKIYRRPDETWAAQATCWDRGASRPATRPGRAVFSRQASRALRSFQAGSAWPAHQLTALTSYFSAGVNGTHKSWLHTPDSKRMIVIAPSRSSISRTSSRPSLVSSSTRFTPATV
jgi:hypothetical protein